MHSPAHARFASRLTALTTDGPVVAAIEALGRARGWWRSDRGWYRTYGRFHPDQVAYATLLFESREAPRAIVSVEVSEHEPVDLDDERCAIREDLLGWLCLTRFPADASLPTLPAVLGQAAGGTVVRYRPGRRCTIRVEAGNLTRFAKVFPDQDGERIYAEGVALWDASTRGDLSFAVARPDRYDAATRTVWQYQVPGSPLVDQLLGPRGAVVAERIGRAVASLNRSPIQPRRVFDRTLQMERSTQGAAELSRRVPGIAHRAHVLLGQLGDRHAAARTSELRPIHGAPHANQWLDDGATLGLVDFDRVALGDPELDAATFLGELDFEDRVQIPVRRLAAAFLAGYETMGVRLDPWRLATYRSHKRLAKALRSARALRPDGDARAGRDLDRAFECLADGRAAAR